MGIWYLDLTGGNDANDGSTFAKRKKTLASFTTGPQAGDTIRAMQSPAAFDTGITATFTKQSISVTLAFALTQNVYTDGAWTAGAEASASTTDAVNKKEGSNSALITLKNGTGQAAYYATGLLNLSAYSQFSFWIKPSNNIAANTLRIDFCTDTVGAVASSSYTIPFALAAGSWYLITDSFGGALSSAIQSINLQNLLAPTNGTTVNIDDVIACGSNFTMSSLIGCNDGYWWPIKSINGTTLVLDANTNSLQGAGKGWWNKNGIYGSQELWALNPIVFLSSQTQGGFTNTGFILSGGWDTTSMSSQTGITWADGLSDAGANPCWNLASRFTSFDHLGTTRCSNSISSNSGNYNNIYFTGINLGPSINAGITFTSCIWVSCNIGLAVVVSNVSAINCESYSNIGGTPGFSSSAWGTVFNGCYSANTIASSVGLGNSTGNQLPLKLINCYSFDHSSGAGFGLAPGCLAFGLTASGNGNTGVTTNSCRIYGLTTSSNTLGSVGPEGNFGIAPGSIIIKNWNATDSVKAYFNATNTLTVYSTEEGGNVNANNIYHNLFTVTATGAGTQSGSGLCWQCKPTSTTLVATAPARFSVGRFYVPSGETATFSYYIARSSSNITGVLRIFGGVTQGVGSYGTDITTTCTPTAATHNPPQSSDYTQYTITAGPTSEGSVIEVWFEFYSTDTTSSIFIDTAGASETP